MFKTFGEWKKEGKTLIKGTQGTYIFTKKRRKDVIIIQMKVLFNQNQVKNEHTE